MADSQIFGYKACANALTTTWHRIGISKKVSSLKNSTNPWNNCEAASSVNGSHSIEWLLFYYKSSLEFNINDAIVITTNIM